MSARMGRPPSSNPKQNDVKVRMDDDLHMRLVSFCQDRGITKAEAIRQAIVAMLEKEQ